MTSELEAVPQHAERDRGVAATGELTNQDGKQTSARKPSSRPIGAFFHVAHGLSNAMLLPAVTAYSVDSAVGRYADCARALGITAPSDSDGQAVAKLVKAVFERNAELQVPSPRKYGIAEKRFFEAIPTMAAQALASGSPQNNPRVPTAAEIEELYGEVWA